VEGGRSNRRCFSGEPKQAMAQKTEKARRQRGEGHLLVWGHIRFSPISVPIRTIAARRIAAKADIEA
jgi:hypothetical protein